MSGSESIEIEVGGETYEADGSIAVGIGRYQRKSVPGGFTEKPVAQFIEGSVVFRQPIRGNALRAIKDATVTYSEASGWRFTMHDAWVEYAEDGARPNSYGIKIVGEIRD